MNFPIAQQRQYLQAIILKRVLSEMKQTDMGHTQALFSLKGEAWVIERLASESVA